MSTLFILGAGKTALTILRYLEHRYEQIVFCVDEKYVPEPPKIQGRLVQPVSELLDENISRSYCLVCIGYAELNAVRERFVQIVQDSENLELVNYQDDSCLNHSNQPMGLNNIFLNNVSVHNNVSIGMGNFFWTNSIVSHDSIVGDFNWLTSGTLICGDCSIGSNNFFGASSCISNGVTIGSRCFVGAGAIVDRDLPDDCVYLPGKGIVQGVTSSQFMRIIK